MPNKSLGQHWLRDRDILEAIADCADITKQDTVLEIGPGLGTLTSQLLRLANNVVAVEFDEQLASKLPDQFPGTNLQVTNQDILQFNFNDLPVGYKVVANVPYYITSKIIQRLAEADNPPAVAVLLVQKEVAQRVAAGPGEMSLLSVASQVFFDAALGIEVDRSYFTPPPEVDSQVLVLSRRAQPLVAMADQAEFFRLVRAGFSERRKKLRSSLAGGLHMAKDDVDRLLAQSNIDPQARAQELAISDWQRLLDGYRQI